MSVALGNNSKSDRMRHVHMKLLHLILRECFHFYQHIFLTRVKKKKTRDELHLPYVYKTSGSVRF